MQANIQHNFHVICQRKQVRNMLTVATNLLISCTLTRNMVNQAHLSSVSHHPHFPGCLRFTATEHASVVEVAL